MHDTGVYAHIQDYREAVKWMHLVHLAVERGHARAQSDLGGMYLHGVGAPQNFIKAHVWLCLATAQGDK